MRFEYTPGVPAKLPPRILQAFDDPALGERVAQYVWNGDTLSPAELRALKKADTKSRAALLRKARS